MAQTVSKQCDICMNGPGYNLCEQCNQWLCDNCKTFHLRSKISRNHTFLIGKNINPEDKFYCKEHNEPFIFYCTACDIPICKLCSVKKHKRHDMSEINESIQGLQAEVKDVIESKIKLVKTNLDKIERDTGRYQSHVKEAIRTITEEGIQMKDLIDKKVQALINSLEEKETASLHALQSIKSEFQSEMEILRNCQNPFTDIQKMCDATKFFKHLKHVKSQKNVVYEKQSYTMPTIKYNKKRNASDKEIFNLFGDISFQ